MKITLDPKLFNPLFYKLLHSKADVVVNYGGSGSGKSFAQIQFFIYKCLTEKEQRILCLRQILSDTKQSIFDIFILILKQWGIYNSCKFNATEKKIVFPNGSFIYCRGLDDPESLKSTVSSSIWIEEATQSNLAAYNQVVLRLRGQQAKNGRIYLTFNPVNKSNWVYQHFFERDISSENIEIIHSTYLDNKFLTDKDRRQLLNFKKTNFAWYQCYALGQFANLETDNLFYKGFDSNKNVKDLYYNPNLPLHISWDENAVPWLSLVVSQIVIDSNNKVNIRIIKEYALFGKNLKTVCNKFISDFGENKNGLLIYGDSTSQKASVFLEQDQNFYDIVLHELKSMNPQKRVLPSNQSVIISGMYINSIFLGERDIDISIDPTCKELINDLENCKVGADGKKDKSIYHDKVKNMKYQKFGHLSDALTYLVIQANLDDYNLFKTGNAKFFKPSRGLIKPKGY